jgi:hypothetical protein
MNCSKFSRSALTAFDEVTEASIYMFYLNSRTLAFVLFITTDGCDRKQVDLGEHNGECGWNG